VVQNIVTPLLQCVAVCVAVCCIQSQSLLLQWMPHTTRWQQLVGALHCYASVAVCCRVCCSVCCRVLQSVAVCLNLCCVCGLRTPLLCVRVEDAVFSYRVAQPHRMPHLYRSFCAKDPYNSYLISRKRPEDKACCWSSPPCNAINLLICVLRLQCTFRYNSFSPHVRLELIL